MKTTPTFPSLTLLSTSALALTLLCATALAQTAQTPSAPPRTLTPRELVSRADLDYTTPATRSEEGMPVGNGRMGSLVWTTPSALHFQINRVDVFAMHASSVSFPRADSDYASSCGYVDINLSQSGKDVFVAPYFSQHLSLYDGLMTVKGWGDNMTISGMKPLRGGLRSQGVTARVVAWPKRDVIAVEITDNRERPEPINIDLRMLRYAVQYIPKENFKLAQNHEVAVHTVEHTATSKLDIREDPNATADGASLIHLNPTPRIVLTQKFEEGDFYGASAIVIGVQGRPLVRARFLNETTVQLSVPPDGSPYRSSFTILIASAGTLDRSADVAALATAELNATTDGFVKREAMSSAIFINAASGFDALRTDTAAWWQDFWSRGYMHLHSADGQADFIEQNYTYALYLMGATSRGKYMPRFGGMLWYTNGDMRRWGSQYWWANQEAYYRGLMPANRFELMNPLFDTYSGMYDSCAIAARQQWGSQGIWIPEITFFDGPEKLPDDIAAELQDLMLVRKPYEQRSQRFIDYAEVHNRHHARWNFLTDGHWQEGRYIVPDKGHGIFGHCTHILGSGVRIAQLYWERYTYTLDETWLRDRAYPMIKGMAEFYRNFPNLTKDADGKYHLHHLNSGEQRWDTDDPIYEVNSIHQILPLAIAASEKLNADPDLRAKWQELLDNLVPAPNSTYRGGYSQGFVYRGPGAIEPQGEDKELKTRFLGVNQLGSFIDNEGIGGAQILRNRLRLREGPGAIDAENICAMTGWVHDALLRNTTATPATPDAPPVLKIFPAWPRDWDVEFTLAAPNAFVISAAQKGGAVTEVRVESNAGANFRMRNPWLPARKIQIQRGTGDSIKTETITLPIDGDLSFPTQKGETITMRAL